MKMKSCLMLFILVFSLVIPLISGFSSSAPPELHTIYIYSDKAVFISEFNPSTNYNSGSGQYYLDVGEDEFSYSYVSFVQFDLSTLPEDADIQDARIGLYLAANPENIPVKMYRVRETWDEDTVTWSTRPSFKDISKTEGLIDSETVTSTGRNYWDVLAAVEEWFDGTRTNYGVALESIGEYFHRFSSDETTYYKPILVVDYYSGSGGGSDPPAPPPDDTEPCEITYTVVPSSPVSGNSVTISATATDNLGLSYLIIKEGSIERCTSYALDNTTTSLTCAYTETLYAPGKTFIIEANDVGSSPPQSITVPISVEGSGSAELLLDIEFRDQNAIPSYYRLLPGDNQTVNVTATATDPDGIRHLSITINGHLYDFTINPPETAVSRTVSVVNDFRALETFRYSAAATDVEGIYTSVVGEDIEIRAPFQWYWGLNFSNWGCDQNHTWSWDLMESIFGDSEIYMDKERDWKYDWAWRLYDAKIRRGGRNGQCFGMCTLALELAHAPARITAHEIQPSASGVDDLLRDEWNTTWRYYYARHGGQYSAAIASRRVAQYLDLYFTDWVASGWTGMHPYLEDLLDTIGDDLEDGDFGILSIREGSSGHAVIPWRIVYGDTEEAIARMYIYDPNHEHVSYHHETDYSVFDHYPFIECNVNSRFSDWWLYQWNATSIWQDEIMYFTYNEAIGDISELNYIDAVDITDHDIAPGIAYLVSIGSGDATYYAEDSSGKQTGIVNGVLKAEIPNSVPMVDLDNTKEPGNILLYLPDNEEFTFYFSPQENNVEYNFSLNAKDQVFTLVNKTFSDDTEEKIVVKTEDSDEITVGIIGSGDSTYTIKCTRKYEDSQGETIGREYIVDKKSSNDHEDIEIGLTKDKESIIIRNNNNQDVVFTVEFRSTESLDGLDYIPSSIGEITVGNDKALSISPSNWMTTEVQADIMQSEVVEQVGTPGFEIILVFSAIFILAILKRKEDKVL